MMILKIEIAYDEYILCSKAYCKVHYCNLFREQQEENDKL